MALTPRIVKALKVACAQYPGERVGPVGAKACLKGLL